MRDLGGDEVGGIDPLTFIPQSVWSLLLGGVIVGYPLTDKDLGPHLTCGHPQLHPSEGRGYMTSSECCVQSQGGSASCEIPCGHGNKSITPLS